MRKSAWAIAALLSASALAAPRGVSIGLGMLAQGRYRMAVQALRAEIERTPDRPVLEIGLGRALSELGRCEEALPHLEPHLARRPFDADAARALARCRGQRDELAEVVYWLDFAHDLAPERSAVQVALALACWEAGDRERAWRLVEELYEEEPASPVAELTVLRLAVDAGEVELADELLWALDARDLERGLDTDKLRGILELDLGHPLAAQNALLAYLGRHRGDAQAVQLRAEAIRRAGDVVTAAALLEGREQLSDPERYPLARSIRARVAADLGELARARVLADEGLAATPLEPEAVASAWYVARALGDAPTEERLAARYVRIQDNPLRTLDKLLLPEETSP